MSGAISRAYAGRQEFDFPTWSRRTLVVSIVLVIISGVSLATQGLTLSIDFEGGSAWEVPSQEFDRAEAESVLDGFAAAEGARFQEATTADGTRILRISGQVEDVAVGVEVAEAFAAAAGVPSGDVTVTTIGPSWGNDITRQAVQSLIWFMVLIGLYLAWRLEPKMAFAALCAVVHDIVLTVGIYSIFQITVTPATVIAFLTILGYSLYDTVVVFDRLHDGVQRYGRSGQFTYSMIMRRTLNQSLMRCVNTSITTILPIMGMLLVGGVVFNQPLLSDFSLALVIGLLLGVYSSMFVAAPIVVLLKEREQRWRDIRSRLASRGVDVSDTTWPKGHKGPLVGAPAASSPSPSASASAASAPAAKSSGGSSAPPLGVKIGGHPPRPRKHRPKR